MKTVLISDAVSRLSLDVLRESSELVLDLLEEVKKIQPIEASGTTLRL